MKVLHRTNHSNAAALPRGGLSRTGLSGGSVQQLMTPNPECIESSQTVFAAAQKMKQLNAGALPVCEVSIKITLLDTILTPIRARTTILLELSPIEILSCGVSLRIRT